MNGDVISIIVPVYNVQPYIERCIKSIVSQTYPNIEIILVDDGSTDGSGQICDKFANLDSRIIVIHQPNQGQSSARNKGLDIAHGNYIGFVDSDDYIESNMYETLLSKCQESGADICLCRSVAEDAKGCIIKYSSEYDMLGLLSKNDMFKIITYKREPKYVVPFNKLYKKHIFESLRYSEGFIYEDERIIGRVFEKSNSVICVNDVLYHYTVRQNSTMTQKISLKNLDAVFAFSDRAQMMMTIGEEEFAARGLCEALNVYLSYMTKFYIKIFISAKVRNAFQKCRVEIISLYNKMNKDLFTSYENMLFSKLKTHHFKFGIVYPIIWIFRRYYERTQLRN